MKKVKQTLKQMGINNLTRHDAQPNNGFISKSKIVFNAPETKYDYEELKNTLKDAQMRLVQFYNSDECAWNRKNKLTDKQIANVQIEISSLESEIRYANNILLL